MTGEPRIYNEERKFSLINGAEEIGQQYAKEWNWITILHHTEKLTQNGLET